MSGGGRGVPGSVRHCEIRRCSHHISIARFENAPVASELLDQFPVSSLDALKFDALQLNDIGGA